MGQRSYTSFQLYVSSKPGYVRVHNAETGEILLDMSPLAAENLASSLKTHADWARQPNPSFPWHTDCARCQGFLRDQHPGLFSWIEAVTAHFEADHG